MIESLVWKAYRFLNKFDVDDVRYEKCCGEKFPEFSKIPPTKDEIYQHVKRVNYQAFVWKNALEANQEMSEAHQHGEGVIDGNMSMCQSVFQQFLVHIFSNGKANVIMKSHNHFLYLMKNLKT